MSDKSLLFRIIRTLVRYREWMMSIVSLECRYIIERIRSIAFQVGSFLGDDSQYNREKQAEYLVDVVVGGGAEQISDAITNTVCTVETNL